MTKRTFHPVQYPSGALLKSLMKADALTIVLQSYMTSDRCEEAMLLPHWLHWYLEAIRDQVRTAQSESERLELLVQNREAA